MSPLTSHIIAFFGSCITAIIIMPWLLSLCRKLELTYDSNDSHHFPIPRIGGMILAPAAAVGLSISLGLRLYHGAISDTLNISTLFILLGMMLIYILGIIDDIFHLSRWQKRTFLLLASLAFPICGLYINDLFGFMGINATGKAAGYVITVIATVLFIKGLGTLRECDGLVGAICLPPLIVYGAIFYNLGYYSYSSTAFAVLGALLVFLYYNLFGDKRIGTKTYMGHAGTMMLSFCIVYMSLKYAMVNPQVIAHHKDGLLLAYSMLIIPIFEYIRVWTTSTWSGLNKGQRRQLHIQHKLEEKNFTQLQILSIILVADLVLIAMNLTLHYLFGVSLTWIVVIDIIVYTLLQTAASRQKKHIKTTYKLPEDFKGYKGKKGLVSVIMPTYNSEDFVVESIESILSQTYKDLELIICDDCSTDNTMVLLREYADRDSRVIILENESNGGPGVSRNNAIQRARGQYIAFCDSDDRWLPKKLERQIDFMSSQDIVLCFAPYYTCDENSHYLGYISAPRRVNLFEMMCDNKMGFLTCIYDTKTLGKHYMPHQRKRQDHALLLNLLKECKFAYSVPAPLAHYRIHDGNISANKISLLKYNAQTYTEVFGWSKPLSYAFLFTLFLPTYFWKRIKNILISIARAV